MESQEFNLSVLDNVATLSTPLKDCSDYEAVLCLIKEEVDVSQSEDEADYQNRSNDASRLRARKRDSKSCGSDGKFKPPYGLNRSTRSKSPGTALISRTKRRSYDDSKNDTKKRATHRARSLGRTMPGRRLKSMNGQQHTSISHSDTSGYSDPTKNDKTFERKSWTPRQFFDCNIKDDCETESEAVAELLTTAHEQITIKESPCSRNSTVSSQGESTSLATTDPLDTGAMEEDCYVESSQQVSVSDFRQKLLDRRSICNMPKNPKTIKRNLHFSDGQETDEENQNFSLILSPDRRSLLNGNVDSNSTASTGRKRTESQDSLASTLNSMTSVPCHFYSEREASTTPPCPRLGKSSQRGIAREFNSSTPNSYNFQSQGEASTTSQQSSISKTSRESTPATQNLSSDVHDLEHRRKKSPMSQSCSTKKTSQASTSSTASTLNLTHDLEDSESRREASTTPEVFNRKPRRDSASSTASTLHLNPDLQDLDLKREASSTPQYSNTSGESTASVSKNLPQELQDLDPEREEITELGPSSMHTMSQNSTASIPKNLSQESQDLDPQREASTTLEPSSMRKTSQDSTASTPKNRSQEQDLDLEREASTAVQPSSVNKTAQDNTLENVVQDRQDLDPEGEARVTLQPSSMNKKCEDSISTLEDPAQDLKNLHPEKESSTTLPHPRKRKTSQDSTNSSRTNLSGEMQNLDPEKETIAASPHLEKPTKTIQDNIDSTDRTSTNLTSISCNSRDQTEASPTPESPSMKKPCQETTVNIRESLTQYLENLNFKREPSATPPHSRHRTTSQNSTASSQKSFTQELSNFECTKEAGSTSPRPKKRKKRKASTVSPAKSPTRDPSNVDSPKEVSVTSLRSRERKRSQDSTTSSQSKLSLETENLDPEKEAFAPKKKPKKKSRHSIEDTDCFSKNSIENSCNSHSQREVSPTEQPSSEKKPSQESTINIRESCTQYKEDLDFKREPSDAPSQSSTASSQKSFTQELSNVHTAQEATSTSPCSKKRKKRKASTVSPAKSPTRDPSNVDSPKEASVTSLHSRERKRSQDSTTSSQSNLTLETENLDPEKAAFAAPRRSGKPKKKRRHSIDDTDCFSKSVIQNSCDSHSQREASPTEQPSSKKKPSHESTINIRESCTQYQEDLDFKREENSAPLQNSTASLEKSFTQELSNVNTAHEARSTSPRPRKRKKNQASTVSAAKSPTRDSINVDSAKKASVTSPCPKKKRKKDSDIASALEGPTQDPSPVQPAKEASLMSPLPKKRKKNKTKMASTSKIETENITNLDIEKEPGAMPPRLGKRQSSVASPLKGLSQELEKCIANVDFERLYEEMENDTESPSFTFETVQLLDDYNECNPEANQILSKILASPKSKTSEKAPRSIEHLSSGEDPLDYDPLYITEAEDNEVAKTSSSKRKDKTGTKKIKNKRKSLTVDESFKGNKEGIDKDDTSKEGSSIYPLDCDPLYIAEAEDNEVATTSSSKRKDKTRTKKIKNNRKSLTVDESFKGNKEDIDTDDTLQDVSSIDPLDCDPLYIAEAEDNEVATTSSSKRKDKTGTKKIKKKRQRHTVDKSVEGNKESIDKDDTLEKAAGADPLDYDPLYIAEGEDNEVSTTSSSKRKDKTGTKKIKNKRQRHTVDKSVKGNKENIDKDDTLEKAAGADPVDYDPLYIAEAEDNEVATTSSSKRKDKTGTKKIKNKRQRHTVDKSVEGNKERIDKDDTLEKAAGADPLDYDPLYIAEAEDNEVATTSSSEKNEETGIEETKNKRKTLTVDKPFEENKRGIDKDDTLEEGSSIDPLDYDSLYVDEPEDNDVANPSTSKRNKKTETNKIKKKRKSLKVDESFKKSKRSLGKDDTMQEDRRRSSRSRKKRETMTLSDWEEGADLSDEAAKVVKKIEAAKREECLSPRILDKLDEMVVQLRYEVLPQHDIEPRAGTAPLTYEQQMRFLDFASLNKDLYSPEEDQIIKRNWNAFCEDHDWNPDSYRVFLQFKHGDRLIMQCMEERRKFVQFLAHGLPNRPLYSVYNRFKKIYSEHADAGEWYTPKEDKMILAYMLYDSGKQPETKFTELAKVLKRSRFSIWKRYRNLKEKRNCHEKTEKVSTKVEWSLPVVTEFIKKLLDVTMSEDLIDLKDAFIPTVVWKRLEQKILIDYNFMKRAWEQQFHLQFFSPEPVSANATKIKLIEYMWTKGIREAREIEWHIVVKYFDGYTISFLRKTFNHMTADASAVLDSRSLSDIMKWLYETKIDRLRRSKMDHYLPRLRYVDSRVEIVHEDMANVTMTLSRT